MTDPKNTEDQELSMDQLKDAAGGMGGAHVPGPGVVPHPGPAPVPGAGPIPGAPPMPGAPPVPGAGPFPGPRDRDRNQPDTGSGNDIPC